MNKLLITGGAGFIGGNFVYYMLENYHETHLVCLDALTYAGDLETLKGAFKSDKFTFVKGDITERVYKGLLNYEIKQYD